MLSLEGKQLGNYDVIRRIRVGGMGAVYEGRQRTAFDRRVAIKVILGDYATDRDMRRRFAREAKTISRLHHPHILQLIEFGDANGILYLVMPFIDGGTLTNYLRRHLPELDEVSNLYQQLLDAVEYAHEQGLIHRDIKSSNVLLEFRKNANPYLYLADFGLVRTIRKSDASQAGKPIPLEQVPGTPHYMAPEQTMGIVTPLTDIYALGVLLYQMLTGNLPYNDPDEVRVIQMHLQAPIPAPSDYDASIPPELDEVVRTAMAKHPEERYHSVSELRDAFLSAIKGPTGPIRVTPKLTDPGLEMVPPTTPLTPDEQRQANPAPRRPIEPPKPIVMHNQRQARPTRDLREQANLTAIEDDITERPRPAETVLRRVRVTDEPMPLRAQRKRRKNLLFPIIATIVTIMLIVLLIAPRVFGMSLLPTTVPIIGPATGATISITAKSQQLQKTFLLTGSPNTKAPDPKLQRIPDRVIKLSQTASETVNTTGNQQNLGIRARGTLILLNNNDKPVTLAPGVIFTTKTNLRFQSLDTVTVPAKQKTTPGTNTVILEALEPGKQGNVPAQSFSGPCCNNQLTINNPQAFDGGQDGQSNRFVSQSDLDGVKDTLQPKLQQQLANQFQKQLASDEIIAGQPIYKVSKVSPDQPVNKPADKVKVTVTLEGTMILYKKKVAEETAMVLLNNQAREQLGPDFQLQGPQTLVNQKVELSKEGNGTIYITISVRGIWTYNFTEERIQKLRDPIKGSTSDVATTYLKTQPGISQVEIRLPFGVDRLPTDTNEISITVIEPPSP